MLKDMALTDQISIKTIEVQEDMIIRALLDKCVQAYKEYYSCDHPEKETTETVFSINIHNDPSSAMPILVNKRRMYGITCDNCKIKKEPREPQ